MIGIILAGGGASRLGGGDKGLRTVGGVPILDRVIATMRAQCEPLLVSANGDAARFSALGLPVVADTVAGRLGPLAGVLAGLEWAAAHRPDLPLMISVPTDTPFLPVDLVARLCAVAPAIPVVCARSASRAHHVVARWAVGLRHDLRRALVEEDMRKVGRFLERHGVAFVDWADAPYDPFFNVNTPDDLLAAERIAAGE